MPRYEKQGRFEYRDLGVAQLVARYLGVVEAASSSLVTQTISSVHNESDEHSIFFAYISSFGAVILLFSFVMPWWADSLPQRLVCSQV